MIKAFTEHIGKNLTFLRQGKLLIACSGGLDSVVLARLCHYTELEISIAHCNFMLRGDESDADEIFVKELASEMGVSFYKKDFDTETYAKSQKLSIQMAARELRYNWFEELYQKHRFDYVLTGHHADDNLETFLINLSRGSGIEGLTGIPEINDIIIRPLLPFSRDQIQEFAQNHHISWREDSSNKETKYLRNKLRHEVIPELKKTSSGFLNNFKDSIDYLEQCSIFIKHQTNLLKFELFEYLDPYTIQVSIKSMLGLEAPETFVYFLFKEFGFTAWRDVIKMLDAQPGKQIFSETHRLIKDRKYLLITTIHTHHTNRRYIVEEGENMLMLPYGNLKFCEVKTIKELEDINTFYVDKEKLKFPLTVRRWEEGDYFYPLGMNGKKKVSKFFKDEKLSLLAKERVWLLCSENEIVWIINHRGDDRYKITPETKEILKIKIN